MSALTVVSVLFVTEAAEPAATVTIEATEPVPHEGPEINTNEGSSG